MNNFPEGFFLTPEEAAVTAITGRLQETITLAVGKLPAANLDGTSSAFASFAYLGTGADRMINVTCVRSRSENEPYDKFGVQYGNTFLATWQYGKLPEIIRQDSTWDEPPRQVVQRLGECARALRDGRRFDPEREIIAGRRVINKRSVRALAYTFVQRWLT